MPNLRSPFDKGAGPSVVMRLDEGQIYNHVDQVVREWVEQKSC
jgi:hypothetical protein